MLRKLRRRRGRKQGGLRIRPPWRSTARKVPAGENRAGNKARTCDRRAHGKGGACVAACVLGQQVRERMRFEKKWLTTKRLSFASGLQTMLHCGNRSMLLQRLMLMVNRSHCWSTLSLLLPAVIDSRHTSAQSLSRGRLFVMKPHKPGPQPFSGLRHRLLCAPIVFSSFWTRSCSVD